MGETSMAETTGNKGGVWAVAAVGALTLITAAAVVLALRNPGTPAASAAGTARTGAVDEILNASLSFKRNGEFGKAEAVLRQATAEHPGEQRLQVELGEVLTYLKRVDEAYTCYDRALAIGPRSREIEFAAGTVANMAGKLDRAEEHYEAAQQADKTDWKAPLFLAQVQLKMNSPEKTEEAKKNLVIAANLKPESATAWGTLADLALRENKTSLALQHIAKARQLEPSVVVWRVIEARALKRENRIEESLGVLVGLNDAERRETGVLATMAECYGMLRRPADAANIYAEASDAEPTRGDWAMEAAMWWERAGEKDTALVYAQRANANNVEGATDLVQRLRR